VVTELVLAASRPLELAGLRAMVERLGDVAVLACCLDGVDALEAVLRLKPDVLMADLHLPGQDGLALAEALGSGAHRTRVVLMADRVSPAETLSALRVQVHGLLTKGNAESTLRPCLIQVMQGRPWLDRSLATQTLRWLSGIESDTAPSSAGLTRREIEVAELAARGLRNKEIAKRLGIHEGTVKIHLHSVYRKLGLRGRVGLSAQLPPADIHRDELIGLGVGPNAEASGGPRR
jgi:DNA-binding NarL/FixJ family response regulator